MTDRLKTENELVGPTPPTSPGGGSTSSHMMQAQVHRPRKGSHRKPLVRQHATEEQQTTANDQQVANGITDSLTPTRQTGKTGQVTGSSPRNASRTPNSSLACATSTTTAPSPAHLVPSTSITLRDASAALNQLSAAGYCGPRSPSWNGRAALFAGSSGGSSYLSASTTSGGYGGEMRRHLSGEGSGIMSGKERNRAHGSRSCLRANSEDTRCYRGASPCGGSSRQYEYHVDSGKNSNVLRQKTTDSAPSRVNNSHFYPNQQHHSHHHWYQGHGGSGCTEGLGGSGRISGTCSQIISRQQSRSRGGDNSSRYSSRQPSINQQAARGVTLIRGESCSLVDIPTYMCSSVELGTLTAMGTVPGASSSSPQGHKSAGVRPPAPPGVPGSTVFTSNRPRLRLDLTKKKPDKPTNRLTQWTVLCVSVTMMMMCVTLVGAMLSFGSDYQQEKFADTFPLHSSKPWTVNPLDMMTADGDGDISNATDISAGQLDVSNSSSTLPLDVIDVVANLTESYTGR